MTDGERTAVLSTGHEVALPLSTEASIVAAAFGASLDGVRTLLPEGLAPIRVTPSRAAVTLMCVEYDRIGRGEIEPYAEFGVLFAAAPDDGTAPADARTASPLSLVTGEGGGYVWTLPVTTEPARALGEIWSYPKTIADIEFEDDGATRRTTVDIGGERLLSAEIRRPRTITSGVTTRSYTAGDDGEVREPLTLRGDFGAAPLSNRVAFSLGDHPQADRLRALDLGSRALARVAFEGEFRIAPPERVNRD